MLTAGSSGTTYFLVKHPDKMVKLVEEIRGAFKSESEMTLQNVTKLQYLDACINEAMRLHPPGPQNFPRRIRPGGANICGYHIPPKVYPSYDSFASVALKAKERG